MTTGIQDVKSLSAAFDFELLFSEIGGVDELGLVEDVSGLLGDIVALGVDVVAVGANESGDVGDFVSATATAALSSAPARALVISSKHDQIAVSGAAPQLLSLCVSQSRWLSRSD